MAIIDVNDAMELNKKYTDELKATALRGILYTALVADPVVSVFVYYISDMDFFIILWVFWVICVFNLYLLKTSISLTIPIMLLLLPVSFILIYNLLSDKIYISYWVYLFPIFSFFFLDRKVSILINFVFLLLLSFAMWREHSLQHIDFILASMCIVSFATIAAVIFMVESFKKAIVEQLEKSSSTDFLTNIGNRREFFYDLEKQIHICVRHKKTFSLIIFDIDHFKHINDNYGHPVGDLILIRLANLTQSDLRKEDGFYRIGGEEFAIILPLSGIEDSLTSAERLRGSVESHQFEHSIKVTVSLGLIEYSTSMDADLMYKAADEALYEAKESGRNCCMIYAQDPALDT